MINAKRLRDYPRLMFITTWSILLINLILRHGWLGAFNQIIGSDFITLYGAGIAYRTDLARLYDFSAQAAIQQSLIAPTVLPGLNPFISPPYVAAAYSVFTYLPLSSAFIIWTIISLGFTLIAVRLLTNLNTGTRNNEPGYWQLAIIVLSFFPFIEGFQVGQNHSLTLLLITCLLLFSLTDHWFLSGCMAGLLIYKPQFIIGFLILWIIWRKYKALLGFLLVAVLWVGSFMILHGIEPYLIYLNINRDLFLLPYVEGYPAYLQVTLYGFLSTLVPASEVNITQLVTTILGVVLSSGLIYVAYKLRKEPIVNRTPALVFAILLPLISSPYALLHDMLILIPAYILWSIYANSNNLTITSVAIYLGSFFLTFVATLTKIAWVSLLVMGLFVALLIWIYRNRSVVLGMRKQI